MIKETLYTYRGTNGSITSPVHLEGVEAVLSYRFTADKGKVFKKGTETAERLVFSSEDRINEWKEVSSRGKSSK